MIVGIPIGVTLIAVAFKYVTLRCHVACSD